MNPNLNTRILLFLLYILANPVLYFFCDITNFCRIEKQHNIILAPCATQVTELYNFWRESHSGRLTDFYKFLTSATDQRDRFLSGLEIKSEFNGIFFVNTFEL